jgi:hypothetical protein
MQLHVFMQDPVVGVYQEWNMFIGECLIYCQGGLCIYNIMVLEMAMHMPDVIAGVSLGTLAFCTALSCFIMMQLTSSSKSLFFKFVHLYNPI